MQEKHMKRRIIIYGVVFSIASYATASALALGTSAYVLGSFTESYSNSNNTPYSNIY